MIDDIIKFLEDWERLPLAIVTMAGPWLTPLVPAYFVAVAIQEYLKAPLIVSLIVGIVLEVVGIAGIANATRAYLWNKNKRKTDETAPLILSIAAVSIYFVTAILLTALLEFWQELASIAPAMFVILSVSSGLILVLSSTQRGRERMVKVERTERKRKRQKVEFSNNNYIGDWPEVSGKTRNRAMAILAERSDISGAELGRQIGRSDRTGRKLKAELLPLVSEDNQNGNK